jgi:hypothetical protein
MQGDVIQEVNRKWIFGVKGYVEICIKNGEVQQRLAAYIQERLFRIYHSFRQINGHR